MFSREICEILKNTYFEEHLQKPASEKCVRITVTVRISYFNFCCSDSLNRLTEKDKNSLLHERSLRKILNRYTSGSFVE